MKMRLKTLPGFLVLGLILSLIFAGGGAQTDAVTAAPLRSTLTAPIIIDHTTTDITQIPPEWIAAVKTMTFHYAHTSHGGQITQGLSNLESHNSLYDVSISSPSTITLPAPNGALRIYDGNGYGGDSYITPEMYWATADGVTHTQTVVNTGLFGSSMWAWCGQMGDWGQTEMQNYVGMMGAANTTYPNVNFILMTGHTNGNWGPTQNITMNYNIIKNYALDNNLALFDFTDMELYDPDGNFYPNADDYCPWCQTWCNNNPTSDLCAGIVTGDCGHTHGLLCRIKAQAFWWMMARLAGWAGPDVNLDEQVFMSIVRN